MTNLLVSMLYNLYMSLVWFWLYPTMIDLYILNFICTLIFPLLVTYTICPNSENEALILVFLYRKFQMGYLYCLFSPYCYAHVLTCVMLPTITCSELFHSIFHLRAQPTILLNNWKYYLNDAIQLGRIGCFVLQHHYFFFTHFLQFWLMFLGIIKK